MSLLRNTGRCSLQDKANRIITAVAQQFAFSLAKFLQSLSQFSLYIC